MTCPTICQQPLTGLPEAILRGPYPQYFFPLYKMFIRPRVQCAIQATHPILSHGADALEKNAKTRSEVHESSSLTASPILSYALANPR